MASIFQRPSSLLFPLLAGRLLRLGLMAWFAWIISQYWHPRYGFTSFLQINTLTAAKAIPAFRDPRIYVYLEDGSYDGAYYAQIATSPALTDPALRSATDDLGYRARRILLCFVAWAAGGGDPVGVAHAYASINVFLWFGLAVLLWRIFPADDWRGMLAWVFMLFSAGVILSVRLALTDLAALLLTATSVLLVERQRLHFAAGLLGLGGLTRETGILGAVALLPSRWRDWSLRRLGLLALCLAVVLLPLGLWLLYLHRYANGSSVGQSNFTWPLVGWFGRWCELALSTELAGNPRMFWETVAAHIALTVQMIYLASHPRRECPWWRVGATYALLGLCLGVAVWEGMPGAATRVLLPLTLAFNIRVLRDRTSILWVLVGNLSVLAGIHVLPPSIPHQLPARGAWYSHNILETDPSWSVAEWNSKWRWAWSYGEGSVTLQTWPRRERAKVELQLRGVTPREVEVLVADAVIWRGKIGDHPQWISLPELPLADGRLTLKLRDIVRASTEVNNQVREISFACFGARIAD